MSTESEPPTARVRGLLQRGTLGDWALAASVLMVGLALLHVWGFARFDSSTTLAMLGVVDRTQVLLATAVTAFPAWIAGFMVARAAELPQWMQRLKSAGPREVVLVASAVTLAVPSLIATTSAFSLLVYASILGLTVLLRRSAKDAGQIDPSTGKILLPSDSRRALQGLVAALAVFVVFSNLLLPWTPREQVTMRDQARHVGYIVGSGDGSLLLRRETSGVIWLRLDEIESRRLCGKVKISRWLSPLSDFIGDPSYTPCEGDSGDAQPTPTPDPSARTTSIAPVPRRSETPLTSPPASQSVIASPNSSHTARP